MGAIVSEQSEPSATVIVCVLNRPAQIVSCLDSLCASDAVDFEIVVVDDGSTDETPQVVSDYARRRSDRNIRLVRNERNLGVSGARNVGIGAARGAFVLFTDSDCTVDCAWVSRMVEALESGGAAAASGCVVDVAPRNLAEQAAWGTTRIGRGSWQARGLVGNNMGFRRSVLIDHPFDASLNYYCDDDDMAWRLGRLGLPIAFVPEAIVHHDHPMTVGKFLRQARRQGVGSARFWYKQGKYVGRDLWFLTASVISLALLVLDSRAWPVPVGLFVLQLLAMLANEVFFKGKRWRDALTALPLLTVYIIVKALSVLATHLRILFGRESNIVNSRRRLRESERICEQRRLGRGLALPWTRKRL